MSEIDNEGGLVSKGLVEEQGEGRVLATPHVKLLFYSHRY